MLGLKSLDELEQKIVPKAIRGNGEELEGVPEKGLSEADALNEITGFAKMNKVLKSFIGMGYVSFLLFSSLSERARVELTETIYLVWN